MGAPRHRGFAAFAGHCEENHTFRREKAAQTMHSAGLWLHTLTEFGYGSPVVQRIRFEQYTYISDLCGQGQAQVKIVMDRIPADFKEASG